MDKKFVVANDKAGDMDYLDHPGDWKGSASNTANCLCNIEFTNKPPDMDYDEVEKNALEYSERAGKEVEERRQKRQKEKQDNKKKTKDKKNNKDNNEKRQDNNQAIQILELPEEVQQVLNDFHDKYKEAPIEHAYLVDTETGQIYQHAVGEEGSVTTNEGLVPMGRQVILIHNHPTHKGFDPFSDADINNTVKSPVRKYCIATNQHRTQIAVYEGQMTTIKAGILKDEINGTIDADRSRMWGKIDNELNPTYHQSIDLLSQNTNLDDDEIKSRADQAWRVNAAHIKTNINNDMTQDVSEVLNRYGVKTWEIQHQTYEERIRGSINDWHGNINKYTNRRV